LSKTRISVVEYLNTAPLVWGFTDGPMAYRYDLSFAVPSQCAEMLRRGAADIGIIPAIEYQRMEEFTAILPGMAVAAKGEVRSILLVAKKPIERARRVALDSSSRSSAALVRLLCREHWHIQPEFIEAAPDLSAMLEQADAALIIGDPALRLSIKLEELSAKLPSGEPCCQGDPREFPVPGYETLIVYDVAYQWRQMTGLPCVLALWVARPEMLVPGTIEDFQESKRYGIERISEIAEGASLKLDLPVPALEKYLRENIDYSLDEENIAGLKLYYEKCAAAELIPAVQPLRMALSVAQKALQR
jgi:chorismate dehydratase